MANTFSFVILRNANVHTISSPVEIIDEFENAIIILPNGTTLHIENALLSGRSKRNILASKMYSRIGTILRRLMSKIKNVSTLPPVK